MENTYTCINIVLSALLAVSSEAAVPEQFYFQIIEDPESIDCSDHVARVSTAPSAMKCCADCSRNGQCQGVMYDPVTMDCKEVNKTAALEDKTCTADTGAAYYSPKVCDNYLVSGIHGVEDDQLDESSYKCGVYTEWPICQPAESKHLSVKYARLNSTGLATGSWVAGYNDQQQYVQVHFRKVTTVTQVVMQARDSAWNPYIPGPHISYVTRFKVLYSQDCSTYDELKQDDGNSLIFEGNSSSDETIVRALPRELKALCFRINPVDWVFAISLRFDLLGCI